MKARKAPLRRPRASVFEDSSNLKKPGKPQASLQSPLKFRPKDILFLQIIASSLDDIPFHDLPEKYGVQDLAPRGRRNSDEGIPFLLGSGTSCHVVQHETSEDTSDIVPKGSLVALKIYRQEGVDYSAPSATASRDLTQIIWQDLRIFCHPHLRNHENFCKLLYIAWEPYSLVPVLALELAAFGSLEDVLQSESDLSPTQKANISMDIALGLGMLHDCGFIHGDIKPSNIMLQEHGERQVLAKILDFSGATDITHYGTTGHKSYMTKLWLAPEVLLGSGCVDWERVDVYAYGLVLAHMWSYKDLDLTEIFLETSLPSRLGSTEKQDFLLYYKCCADEDNMSVVRQALRTVYDPSINDEGIYERLPLDDLIRGTLARDPGRRSSMSHLMLSFHNFALAEGRDFPKTISREEAQDAETKRWNSASDHDFFVFSRAFTRRSDIHQQMTLHHMKVVSKEPMLNQTPLIAGSNSDFEDPSSLWMLLLRNDGALDSVGDDESYCRVLHYQIAACLFQGQGSKVDDVNALRYLASAALGGIKRAMYMLQQVESYSGSRLPFDIPRRLFLVLGHLNGCSETSDILRVVDPRTFSTAQLLSNLIRWTDLTANCSFLRLVLTPESDAIVDEDSGLSKDIRSRKGDIKLFTAIEDGNVPWVKYLLTQGLDPNARNHCGMSPLHSLALIADEAAAEIVEPLIQAGASTDYEYVEPFAYWKNRVCNGRETALVWAVVKNKTLLFERLLKVGSSLEASNYRFPATVFILIVSLRRYQMLEMIPKFSNSINEVLNGHLSPIILDDALTYCVEEYADGDSIGRRWSLGQSFDTARESTVNLLLAMGANPLSEPRGSKRSPLAHAILQGDGVCVKAFVEHLRRKEVDITKLMSRDGVLQHLRGANQSPISWSALRGSLDASSRAAFIYILNEFPSTIDQLSSHGLSPLSHAASEGDVFAVNELLKHGATFQPSQQGSSPFVDALCNGSVEVAATILGHLGKERLLGPNSLSNGHNAFSLVLHTYTAGRRHIGLTSFHFLQDIGGLAFITNESTQKTVFQVFFRSGRPSYHVHRSTDLGLLRYFLRDEVFRRHIDEVSATGLGAIHYAAIHVFTEAAEILLEYGASVNLKTAATNSEAQKRRSAVGWTALDFAVNSYIHGTPEDIKIGGSTEIRAWKLRLEALIRLLVDNGGENSSKAPWIYPMHVRKIIDPSAMRHIHIQYAVNPTPGEEIWRGTWPKWIPRCSHTSGESSDDKSEEQAGDAGTILKNRSIIYRTRKGKKIKTTEMMLSHTGSMLESDSEEESEVAKEQKQKQLKHARAAIEARMAEQSMVELSLGLNSPNA